MTSACPTGVHVAPGTSIGAGVTACCALPGRFVSVHRAQKTSNCAGMRQGQWQGCPLRRESACAAKHPARTCTAAGCHSTTLPESALREWMGVDRDQFYDAGRIVTMPMAFCFPGHDHRGADLPPPRICSEQWHEHLFSAMPQLKLFLLIGYHAQRWHLGAQCRDSLTANVAAWEEFLPSGKIPLPHPSWRNNGWLRKILGLRKNCYQC